MQAVTAMASSKQTGRWVIVIDQGEPPVFWSPNRETLDIVCRSIQRGCPGARVVWEDAGESMADAAEDRWIVGRPSSRNES